MAPIHVSDVLVRPWESAVQKDRVISIRPSKHQQEILQMVAISSAGTSFLSAMVTIYWFVKMRRSFRHNLILFMILSDLIKAICYIVFPIVQFAVGIVPASSAFCQATGFFIALGLEGTDFAVLVIAIHTALCIFKSRRTSKESGLYQYRYVIYTLWIVVPVMLASLAFTNKGKAYMPQGTSCYLPVRPLWFRLALSWIPRYLTFFTIFVIYTAIFLWVKYQFNSLNFQANDSYIGQDMEDIPIVDQQASMPDSGHRATVGLSEQGPSIEMQVREASGILPATPKLNRHGHIPSDGGSRNDVKSRKASVSSALCEPNQTKRPLPPQSNKLDHDYFQYMSDPFITELRAERERMELAVPDLVHQKSLDRDSGIGSMSENSSPYDDSSVVGILEALRDPQARPLQVSRRATPSEPRNSKNFTNDNAATMQIRRRQKAINRQLRLVFVYPVTYCLAWFLPFVNHCLQYSDNYVAHPPFPFLCVAGFSLAFQTAVYCSLFCVKEKPWKHISGSDGTFTGSFKFWKHVYTGQISRWHPRRRQRSHGSTVGRRMLDVAEETRLAYQRRGAERAEAINKLKAKSKVNSGVRDTKEINWFDYDDHSAHGNHGRAPPTMIVIPDGRQHSANAEIVGQVVDPRPSLPMKVAKPQQKV
ncbi:MAG: hypothetical protein M1835_005243 [Candelina submexicana]|nr:MAG: hypothetical protein M1835_005243 [Candelina submexicana]